MRAAACQVTHHFYTNGAPPRPSKSEESGQYDVSSTRRMDENHIYTLGRKHPEGSGIDFASTAIIDGRDQAVAALLLARASDPSLKFQRL
jgi:hypothetical protein